MHLCYLFCAMLLYVASNTLAQNHNIVDVDFMQSMTDNNEIAKEMVKKNFVNLKIMKDQYEAKKPSKMSYQETPFIPKIMHHLWDGPLPPLYKHYFNECKKLHPNWEFKIWGDEDIKKLRLEYIDLYDKSRSYQGRSDIARYEILYKFGGVYRDMDVKCFRPIDDLNHKYDFYAPIEFPTVNWQMILNNGVIAARPSHPILKTTLDIIRDKFDQNWRAFDQGNDLDSFTIMVAKSSMLPLTDSFIIHSSFNDRSIVLPSTYFWSLAKMRYHTLATGLKYMIFKDSSSVLSSFNSLRPETLMHHNMLKEEIPSTCFDYGNDLGDLKIKRNFNALKSFDKRIIKSFRQIYNMNKPHKVPFNSKSKIEHVINFVVFNKDELNQLKQNLLIWKVLNADFEFQIWDIKKIISTFKELNILVPINLREYFRFYTGLKILNKFGGSYAHFKVLALKPIYELNNKYNFYAGLTPLVNSNSTISFSQKLIGSSKNHPIISQAIGEIDLNNISSLKIVDRLLIDKTYKNLYLYDSISAKNIVLPAVYFEPLKDIPYDCILNKIQRFIFNTPKAFSRLTDFAIVK